MKWLVIIIILLVIAGALALRTLRSGPDDEGSRRPHRIDDSPTQHPAPATPEQPGSDFARKPGITGDGVAGPTDPPTDEGRA